MRRTCRELVRLGQAKGVVCWARWYNRFGFMNLFGTLVRLRRGELNMVLLVALLAMLALPDSALAAPLPPHSCAAVLLWLQHDVAAAISPCAEVSSEVPFVNVSPRLQQVGGHTLTSRATAHCGAFVAAPVASPQPDATAGGDRLLEWHEAASRSGINSAHSLE